MDIRIENGQFRLEMVQFQFETGQFHFEKIRFSYKMGQFESQNDRIQVWIHIFRSKMTNFSGTSWT